MKTVSHKTSCAFKKSVFSRALAIAFGVGAVGAGMTPLAYAQSNAAGTVFGTTSPGSTVVLENTGTGTKRTVSVDASGRFQATALQPGSYKAQLMKGDKVTETTQIEVLLGQGTEVRFGGESLTTVQVVGQRKSIDVSSSNSNTTFTAKQLDALPVAKDVGAIIQLAPNTTRGDPRYPAGSASFGGASVSENAYYINGFPVTNPLNQLGSSQLPFGAIGQAQVYTGGFGAEFGRSNGGVVNIVTKSGTNNWEASVSASIEPQSLRAKKLDLTYGNTGDPANAATDGTLYRRLSEDSTTQRRVTASIGGPIIKDKLFMFVAAESINTALSGVNPQQDTNSNASSIGKWGWSDRDDNTNRYLGKFDWNLTDDHRLELTLIGDQSTRREQLSGYNYATGARSGDVLWTSDYKNSLGSTPIGMNDQILKYTGTLTDDLTVSALIGKSQIPRQDSHSSPTGAGTFTRGSTVLNPASRVPGIVYNSPQALAGLTLEADSGEDQVDSKRLDLEWKVGQHTLRGGIDNNRLSSVGIGRYSAGGGNISYRFTPNPSTFKGQSSDALTVAQGGGLGSQGFYGRERVFDSRSNAYSDQSAYYVEDRYQVTKDLLLTFGLRNESFQNKNNNGESYLEQNNVLVPRFGAAWDVNGDASLKVYGSAGRYNVQLPTSLAARGATPSTLTSQFFTYSGVDINGQPIGRVNLGAPFSSNGEFGQFKVAGLLSATDLKPNQQDELILGFERAVSPDLNFGARFTYRRQLSTIDDYCSVTPFLEYAARNGIAVSQRYADYAGGATTPACIYFNPGQSNTFLVDYSGSGDRSGYRSVTLSAADMGFASNTVGEPGPAKRTYAAIDLFFEHPLRNGWYGKVNYTYSRNEGNAEGQTNSDTGQLDVGETAAWDFGALSQYASGLLPNDRTHQIKAYGFYELTPQWTIGANLLLASGRPISCIGFHPDQAQDEQGYASAFHYCDGKPSPRGTSGNLPWDKRLDLNFSYKPEAVKGLSLKVDVFNVFNAQTAQIVEEDREADGFQQPVSSLYNRVRSYTAPRSVKLSAEYNYKF
jgi:hypothetical protein